MGSHFVLLTATTVKLFDWAAITFKILESLLSGMIKLTHAMPMYTNKNERQKGNLGRKLQYECSG